MTYYEHLNKIVGVAHVVYLNEVLFCNYPPRPERWALFFFFFFCAVI